MFSPNTGYYFNRYSASNSGDLKAGNIVIVVAVDSDQNKLLVVRNGQDKVIQLDMSEVKETVAPVSEANLQKAAEVYAVHKQKSSLPENYDLNLSDTITIEDEGSLTQSLIDALTYQTADKRKVTNHLIVTDELSRIKEGKTWTEVTLELVKSSDVNKFQQGGALLNALSEGEHVKAGFDSSMKGFMEWVTSNFGFKQAKAYQLMTIYHRLTNLDVTEDKIRDIGYRKLYNLCNYMTAENAQALLNIARNNNYEDMRDTLNAMFDESGGVDDDTQTFDDTVKLVQNVKFSKYSVSLSEEESELLAQAIHKFSLDNPDVSLSDKNPLRSVFVSMMLNYLDSTSPLEVLQQAPERIKDYLDALHPNLDWTYSEVTERAQKAQEDYLSLEDYA